MNLTFYYFFAFSLLIVFLFNQHSLQGNNVELDFQIKYFHLLEGPQQAGGLGGKEHQGV